MPGLNGTVPEPKKKVPEQSCKILKLQDPRERFFSACCSEWSELSRISDPMTCYVTCSRMRELTSVGEWLSLVEHLVRDQGVGGSNPLSPTNCFQ